MMDEVIILGRNAYMDGKSINSNPYSEGSTEYGLWLNAWLGEQAEVEQLSIQFSANKENVEKKEQTIIDLTKQNSYLEERCETMENLLLELVVSPPFWYSSCKNKIVDVCKKLFD